MPNYNKVVMIGHLTRDPEMKVTQNNTAIVNTGLAVNHKYKDKEEVCFIDIEIWGKQAEIIAKYLHKGDPLLVEGRLKMNSWEKDGQKRTKHVITVENFTMLGSKGERKDEQAGTGEKWEFEATERQPNYSAAGGDDIPF